MPRARLARLGDSLAIDLPDAVAEAADLGEGDQVEITPVDDGVRIRPVTPGSAEALFASRSADEWRRLYAGAFDWGDDLGREIVEP